VSAPTFSVSVEGEPPERHDAGVCADRSSPRAAPLFAAARRIVERDVAAYPLNDPVRCSVISAAPLRDHDEYDAITAIEEVLVDAGVLLDERLVLEERTEIQPSTPGYTVELQRISP
jgi:hypothetical protein